MLPNTKTKKSMNSSQSTLNQYLSVTSKSPEKFVPEVADEAIKLSSKKVSKVSSTGSPIVHNDSISGSNPLKRKTETPSYTSPINSNKKQKLLPDGSASKKIKKSTNNELIQSNSADSLVHINEESFSKKKRKVSDVSSSRKNSTNSPKKVHSAFRFSSGNTISSSPDIFSSQSQKNVTLHQKPITIISPKKDTAKLSVKSPKHKKRHSSDYESASDIEPEQHFASKQKSPQKVTAMRNSDDSDDEIEPEQHSASKQKSPSKVTVMRNSDDSDDEIEPGQHSASKQKSPNKVTAVGSDDSDDEVVDADKDTELTDGKCRNSFYFLLLNIYIHTHISQTPIAELYIISIHSFSFLFMLYAFSTLIIMALTNHFMHMPFNVSLMTLPEVIIPDKLQIT